MANAAVEIPNYFFDVFARMVPGSALVYGLHKWGGPNLLKDITDSYGLSQGGATPWLVVTIIVTYGLGHALSPGVKLLGLVGKYYRETSWYRHNYPERLESFKSETARYNRLRFRYPSVLVYATRIRAESTMYGGIAVAILVTHIYGLLAFGGSTKPFEWHGMSLALFCGMTFRYYDLHRRFCETITAFAEANI